MNQQPISHPEHDGTHLLVHHFFNSIQGEGPFAGVPALFLRLAGCNLRCPACDTEYTVGAYQLGAAGVLDAVRTFVPKGHLVVISGGEPFRQNLLPLLDLLLNAGYRIQVETNGTLYLPIPKQVTVVCSPKTPNLNPSIIDRVDAFKYVLDADHVHPEDGLPTQVLGLVHKASRVARPPAGFPAEKVYLQPVDDGRPGGALDPRHTAAVVKSCMKYGYRLCLQMHKLVNLE